VIIHGRVQGVGYRAWTADEAAARGLEGYVRNRRNGTVEAVFAGPAHSVADMIAACRQGPLGAAVVRIDQFEDSDDLLSQRRAGERFSLLPTR
jgi:acylphosphatase